METAKIHPVWRTLLWLVIAGIGGLAVFGLSYAAFPYAAFRALFDALSSDGDASGYSSAFHGVLAPRLVVVGGLAATVLVTALLKRRWVNSMADRLGDDARIVGQRLRETFLDTFITCPLPIRLAFALVFAVGIGLRLIFLNQPIVNDEAATYLWFASEPLWLTVSKYPFAMHHALLNVSMHFSTRLFGSAEWAIRLPVFLSGVLVIPLTHWFGTRAFGRIAGLFAAAVAAVAWPLVEYSVNARGYALGTLGFACMLGLAPFVARSGNRFAWLLGTAAATFTAYAAQSQLFAVVMAGLWIVFLAYAEGPAGRGRGAAAELAVFGTLAGVAVLALYAPIWLPHGLHGLLSSQHQIGQPRTMPYTELFATTFGGLHYRFTIDIPAVVQAAIAVALLAALWKSRRARLLILAVGVGLIPMFAMVGNWGPPIRILTYLLVPLGVVAGQGLDELIRLARRESAGERIGALVTVAFVAWVAVAAVRSNAVTEQAAGAEPWARDIAIGEILPRLADGDVIAGGGLGPCLVYNLERYAPAAMGVRPFDGGPIGEDIYLRVCSSGAVCAKPPRSLIFVTDGRAASARMLSFFGLPADAPAHGEILVRRPDLTIIRLKGRP